MCDKKQPAVQGLYQANVETQGVGLAKGFELGFAGYNAIQYSPEFVMFVLDLYVNPAHREYLLRRDDAHVLLSAAQHRREAVDMLERAGIVREEVRHDRDFPYTVLVVDEEALRVYVNAVCHIGLPRKHWMPT